jgi:polysaccharide export outer membrane protein
MQRIFWCLLVLVGVLSSCVPNRRIVYLQNPVEPAVGEVKNTDSAQRTYTTHFTDYVLRSRDIISLRIASITPGEYDFIQKYEEKLGLIRKLTQYDQSNKATGLGQQGMMGGVGTQGGSSSLMLDRLQSGFIIDEEGALELPYIGKVMLSGLTLPAAEALVKEKLKGYFETPVVRIQLLSFNFTILGEVKKEGRYTAFDPNATIIDAIALADNLNDYADRSKIKIIRTQGNTAKVYYVNTLAEDLLGQPGFYLQPNDVIIVPPLKARYAGKYVVPNYTLGISILTATLSLTALVISLSK